jgi:hypothetical protein
MRRVMLMVAVAIAAIVLLATIVCNSGYVQNKLISLATDALEKELNTEVQIEGIGINLLGQHVTFYDVSLKDQQQRDLVRVKEIFGDFRLLPLMCGRVALKECRMSGIDLLIIKPEDGPANYQFLLDSTKKGNQNKKKQPQNNIFQLDLQYAKVDQLHVRYNDEDYYLGQAAYSDWRDNKHLEIKGLNFKTNNHKPRRNQNRPHRGAFDEGHMDLVADMGFDILRADKDTVCAKLTKCCIQDTIAGINLNDVRADILYSGKHIRFSNVVVQQITTRIDIPRADIMLPDKEKQTTLYYRADGVTARVMLKDIAKPFSPALSRFSIPLNLRVSVDGTDHEMTFRGIHVNTDDELLTINAIGLLRNLTKARDLTLHFEVHDMIAKPGIKDKIINQFTVKKYMMYQIYAMGVVKYHGSFDILWRKEQFRGLLNTEKGDVDFEFQLDESTKYLTGRASTNALHLGDLFNMKNLGNIDCSSTFKIDYSKQRTAEMRKEKGGKLPIGEVKADIRNVEYRNVSLKNLLVFMESDGALSTGHVTMKGHMTDLMLEFSFTNTAEMQKVKVKPRLKYRHLIGN